MAVNVLLCIISMNHNDKTRNEGVLCCFLLCYIPLWDDDPIAMYYIMTGGRDGRVVKGPTHKTPSLGRPWFEPRICNPPFTDSIMAACDVDLTPIPLHQPSWDGWDWLTGWQDDQEEDVDKIVVPETPPQQLIQQPTDSHLKVLLKGVRARLAQRASRKEEEESPPHHTVRRQLKLEDDENAGEGTTVQTEEESEEDESEEEGGSPPPVYQSDIDSDQDIVEITNTFTPRPPPILKMATAKKLAQLERDWRQFHQWNEQDERRSHQRVKRADLELIHFLNRQGARRQREWESDDRLHLRRRRLCLDMPLP